MFDALPPRIFGWSSFGEHGNLWDGIIAPPEICMITQW